MMMGGLVASEFEVGFKDGGEVIVVVEGGGTVRIGVRGRRRSGGGRVSLEVILGLLLLVVSCLVWKKWRQQLTNGVSDGWLQNEGVIHKSITRLCRVGLPIHWYLSGTLRCIQFKL